MPFATDESVWDEFLKTWPIERLRKMTLEEYTQSGNKDTFTYWMESRLDSYGSIWGGSAFKFGIYSRSDQGPKQGDNALAYTDQYGWYQKFGDTPQTAFEAIRAQVVSVAKAARDGKLEDIDNSELGPTYRWKIAFHYQDRSNPSVTCVFSRKALLAFLGLPLDDKATPIHKLQQQVMARRPADTQVTAFGADIWQKWRISHPLRVKLTAGAIKHGYLAFNLTDSPFPESMNGDRSGNAPGETARFRTDRNETFYSDIRATGASGRLRHRLGTYFGDVGAEPDDIIEVSPDEEGGYVITHSRKDKAPAPQPTVKSPATHGIHEPTAEYVMQPVNRILFGPPGTGKTFRTINEALRILDPAFLRDHEGENKRAELKRRFDELVDARRIRFVTFHQSFSYEDFVEGIRATTDEQTGSLRYDVEDGVFKQVCEAARSKTVSQPGTAISIGGRRVWKVSLGDAVSEDFIFQECMERGIALLGYGEEVDFTGVSSRAEIFERLHAAYDTTTSSDYSVTALDQFIRQIKVGDLIVATEGNLKFRAVGEVTGDYVYMPHDDRYNYIQSRPVRWLLRYDPARPYTDLMDKRFSQMTIYQLHPGSIDTRRLDGLLESTGNSEVSPPDWVLVIDEINRGNISRIFGELITLIEPSKRAGASEALEVVLPYSKESFSVPSNVHLIGTMNTADRSLAGLDVALRRRFEFVEVLPDPATLDGIVVEDVSIADLLIVMNRRIEVLMGRDYMLGHAYFLGLRTTPTIEALGAVFHDKVLPLLQEYFYDDWQKIAWVLNDHRKPEALRFVQQVDSVSAELFGDGVDLPNDAKVWQVNADAFDDPAAYQGIIAVTQASA